MIRSKVILILLLLSVNPLVHALAERHVMILRHGEGECDLTHVYHSNPAHTKFTPNPLTDRGRLQIKKAADTLLSYGFDNRSIVAVYVSPLPRTLESAHILAQIGIFNADKIHIDKRLTDIQAGDREGATQSEQITETWLVGSNEAQSYHGESNADVRKRMVSFYDELDKKHPTGHVLIISHGIPAMELIDSIGKQKVQLELGQMYVLPLANRNVL